MSTDCSFEPLSLPPYSPCLAKRNTPTKSKGLFLDYEYHWYDQFIQLGTYDGPSSGSPSYLDLGLTGPHAPELPSAGPGPERFLRTYTFGTHAAATQDEGAMSSPLDTSTGHLPSHHSLPSCIAPAALALPPLPTLTTREVPSRAAPNPPRASSLASDASSATSSASSHKPRNAQVSVEEWRAEQPTFGWRQQCPWCNTPRPTLPTDWDRHLETHCRAVAGNSVRRWCVGVPFTQAFDYGVAPDAPGMDVNGVRMVGGCGKTFARRDALLRHLQNSRVCVGHGHKMSNKASPSLKLRKTSKPRTSSKRSKQRA
ncbi:hypothetical protein VTO73DRAFT_5651 [Trametes versicolor]